MLRTTVAQNAMPLSVFLKPVKRDAFICPEFSCDDEYSDFNGVILTTSLLTTGAITTVEFSPTEFKILGLIISLGAMEKHGFSTEDLKSGFSKPLIRPEEDVFVTEHKTLEPGPSTGPKRQTSIFESTVVPHTLLADPNPSLVSSKGSCQLLLNSDMGETLASAAEIEFSCENPEIIDSNEDEDGNHTVVAMKSENFLPSSPTPPSQSATLSFQLPEWAADASSAVCMACNSQFTMLRRRHHCRTCGRLLCANCTPHRVPLPFAYTPPEGSLLRLVSLSSRTSSSNNETRLHRICVQCFHEMYNNPSAQISSLTTTALTAPQIGVSSPESLDPSQSNAPSATAQRRPLSRSHVAGLLKDDCLIPRVSYLSSTFRSSWPPLVIATAPELLLEFQPSDLRVRDLLAADCGTVTFAVTRNLHVLITTIGADLWSFISHGLYTVGQEEVCLLLRRRENEALPPLDALWHYYLLYDLTFWGRRSKHRAHAGTDLHAISPLEDVSFLLLPNPSTDKQPLSSVSSSTWFGDTCCGFFYVHPTRRHAQRLIELLPLLPHPPFLLAITLRHPNEASWGARFPLRLFFALSRGVTNPLPLSDRDRPPVFTDSPNNSSSVLSPCCNGGGACFVHVPGLNILVSGLGTTGEIKLQLLFRHSTHDLVRHALHPVIHGENLPLCLVGDLCVAADCHLAVADSASSLTQGFTSHDALDWKTAVVGASFVLLEGIEGCDPSLSVVEDGCVVCLTTEQFKTLLSHIEDCSPLQIRIKSARGLETLLPINNGALVTVNWSNEPISLHSFALHCSCIDGRWVEPRCTFVVPRENQLRHWLMRQRTCEELQPVATDMRPRIAWTRLHSLAARPIYAVDNKSGEVLDLFAVFNAVAATFVSAIFPYATQLRRANHRSISLRILLQPPNTFNFFVGSNLNFRCVHQSANSPSPFPEDPGWRRSVCTLGKDEVSFPPAPLISDPGYVSGLDSALIPLLDGLVHNISCSWHFDNNPEPGREAQTLDNPLTAPGFLLEFDFDLLD